MINNIEELEKIYECSKENLNWFYISEYQKLSESFIEKFQDEVNWFSISEYQKLSESFIEKFQYKVYWDYIFCYQKLSESFIEKFQDKVNWFSISKYQKLSENFIEKFQHKVEWDYISTYQKLSEDFIKKHNFTISDDNWNYKSFQWKKDYIINTGLYEVFHDYIIAYKSCRSDGYSKFNFQHKYEIGKSYSDHADPISSNDASFGLSAWTYDSAKKYCDELIFKVKIYINDIACLVHDDHKIRASKITILQKVE